MTRHAPDRRARPCRPAVPVRWPVLVGFMLAAAACQPTRPLEVTDAFPITVVAEPRVLTIVGTELDAFGADDAIDEPARERIAAFLDTYRERGRGPLTATMVGFAATGRGRDAEGAVLSALTKLARRRGLQPDALLAARAETGVPRLELAFRDFVAIQPDCPPEQGTLSSFSNRSTSSFGCASQRNLAAMIARPADLVTPQALTRRDSLRAGGVTQAYRSGEATGAEQEAGLESEAVLAEVGK